MSGQDQEITNLKAGVSCATLLERRAWKLDKIQSTRHCWKYRRGAGELLICGSAWKFGSSAASVQVVAVAGARGHIV